MNILTPVLRKRHFLAVKNVNINNTIYQFTLPTLCSKQKTQKMLYKFDKHT